MTRLHRPKAGFWIRLWVMVILPLDALFFRVRWHNLDRIPARGGVLLVVNHISMADTATTAKLVWEAGRIPRFLVNSGVFTWPLIGRAMRGAGQIPVHRGEVNAGDSVRDAIAALERGECVIIYPEGRITRDPDTWPMAAKTGVARIALATPGVPVIPIGQWGAHRTLALGGRFRPIPRKRHEASVGVPVDLDRFRQAAAEHAAGGGAMHAELRGAADEIMVAITREVAYLRGEVSPR